MDADDYEPGFCPICASEMEWIDCDQCDDGECCDEDPINGDEFWPCVSCNGNGGYLQCSRLPHSDEQMAAYRARPQPCN